MTAHGFAPGMTVMFANQDAVIRSVTDLPGDRVQVDFDGELSVRGRTAIVVEQLPILDTE
ncbi:MAG: hypothetical protein K0S37_2995 [Microbacterium sp.]|jgi:FKBP-type peptidyl-prolyl cis-trans isomerase 2|nr:hypothetical protein [Microbacterium sp.]